MEAYVAGLQQQMAEQAVRIEELKKLVTKTTEEKVEAYALLNNSRNDLRDCRLAKDEADCTIVDLQRQIGILTGERNQAIYDETSAKNNAASVTIMYSRLKDEVTRLRSGYGNNGEAMLQKIQDLTTEISNWNMKYQKKCQQIDGINRIAMDLADRNTALEKQVHDIGMQLRDAQDTAEELFNDNEIHAAQDEESGNLIGGLRSMNTILSENLIAALTNLESLKSRD